MYGASDFQSKICKNTYNHDLNILILFMFDQIFLSLQLKWSEVICNKHGIYELPQ